MIKLNICSGPNVFPHDGWTNFDRADISDYLREIAKYCVPEEMPPHQQRLVAYLQNHKIDFKVRDIKDGFPEYNNNVDIIYVGQSIEHLNPIYAMPPFIQECYRILKPGGVLRMTTPDLDLLINCYLSGDLDKFSSEQPSFYKDALPSDQLAFLMYGASGPNCRTF